jgi:hypothetical protein
MDGGGVDSYGQKQSQGGACRIQLNHFPRLLSHCLGTWFRGSVLHQAITPLQVMPRLNEFPCREAAFDIRSSVLSLQKAICLQTSPIILPEFTRCGLGEHALPTQQRALVDGLPCLGGDPTLGRTLPWGGRTTSCWSSLYPALSCALGPREGRGGIVASAFGTASTPPPLCINYGNKSMMVGVVQRHPNAYTLKSSAVGFPP